MSENSNDSIEQLLAKKLIRGLVNESLAQCLHKHPKEQKKCLVDMKHSLIQDTNDVLGILKSTKIDQKQ